MKVTENRLIALIACAIMPINAYAYLDPGSGSFIFQMLIAGLLATAFKMKAIWLYIKSFFTRNDKSKTE